MQDWKPKITSFFIIVLAWLFALAIVYIVIVKIKMLM